MEETIQTKEAAAAAPPADDVGATAPAPAPTHAPPASPAAQPEPEQPAPKRRGRPLGSKNKPKAKPSHSPRRSSQRTLCCCCSRPCSRARARGTRASPDDAGPDARRSPALARRPLRRAADAKHNGSLSKASCRASSRATSG